MNIDVVDKVSISQIFKFDSSNNRIRDQSNNSDIDIQSHHIELIGLDSSLESFNYQLLEQENISR